MKKYLQFTLIVSALLLNACSTNVIVPDVTSYDQVKPNYAWSRVLRKHVDKQGRVNFKAVAERPRFLEQYVDYISRVNSKNTPDAFANDNVKLAYYLNSYNALSMYNVIDSGIPESLSGLKKAKFFYFKKFKIGEEYMSLYTYENEFIRKMGDERVHFALNCMSRGCPRLPRKPFSSRRLNKELEREAWRFFNEDRNVKVNHEEKTVYLSEILDFFPEDFLKKAPSLIAYANQYRKKSKKLPEDYEVDFIDYDWTINAISQINDNLLLIIVFQTF